MDKMTKKIVGAFAAILVIAALILTGYFMMNKQAEKKAEESVLPTTEVGKLLAKDLETKYPETPTEVVKLYWRINRCIYNEDTSEKDMEAVLKQLRNLYDNELLQDEKNTYENMLKKLKDDKKKRVDAGQTFLPSVVQKNNALEIVKMDGKDSTAVMTATTIKGKEETTKVYERFVCRRGDDGKWKILGWQQVTQAEAEKVDIE
ncbi:MAG: hypothetical protein HFH62_04775 [Lachnospiraceae bacterium]|nr:hypothetical protein [Lachnospiraceae bacterium]